MRRLTQVSFALLLAGLGLLGLTDPTASAAAAPKSEATEQDVVFLAESQPILIRLRIRIDGKPLLTVWEMFMDKLFRHLDSNKDGVLSKEEAERAPPVQALFNTALGGGAPSPGLAVMDSNRDGKVSRAELANYYRRSGAAPFQSRNGSDATLTDRARLFSLVNVRALNGGMQSADALNERLFALLDTDKDGKLSRAELAAAPRILAKLDADDDEMLTSAELLGNQPSGDDALVFAVELAYVDATIGMANNGPFHIVSSAGRDVGLAKRLLSQYGAKGARKLSAKALGLDKEAFDRLDADGDGELDAEELARFANRAPDLEFAINLRGRGQPVQIEHIKRGRAAERAVVRGKNGLPMLDLNNTRVELSGPVEAVGGSYAIDTRQQVIAQFKAADRDNNGYLDEKEARTSPFFQGTFKLMDRDGDGMLYLKEVLAYLDAMAELSEAAMASVVSLSLSDQGKGLFDLLDTDKDGRLSVRELRRLPKLLDELDRDGDGKLARTEIPRNFRATFEMGPARLERINLNQVTVLSGMVANLPPQQRIQGPLWFRKMDRNRDGDVSRREFLGTDEQFRRLDTDGDGLISATEATAYDRRLREAKKR